MYHTLVALLMTFTVAFHSSPRPEGLVKPLSLDARPTRLEAFFDLHRCPVPHHVLDYIRAADNYALDYRLLPAISLRESTCGRYGVSNNYWGWSSGSVGFASVPKGIEYVAWQLADSPYYKGKTLLSKLHTYNRNPVYSLEIGRFMEEIEGRQ